jgi:hypothetical protein
MVKQFKRSLAALGKVEQAQKKESIRTRELEYKTKHYLVSLSKHIKLGKFDSKALSVENIENYLNEAITESCKKESEVRAELESKLPYYAAYLRSCIQNKKSHHKKSTLGVPIEIHTKFPTLVDKL